MGHGALPEDKHVMPCGWRTSSKLGANFVQAGLWKGSAIRDGNLITGQQNFSGAETAEVIVEASGADSGVIARAYHRQCRFYYSRWNDFAASVVLDDT